MSQRHARKGINRAAAAVACGAVEALNADGVRLLLDAVLFDGAGISAWHARAACREADPEVFFPSNGPEAFHQRAEAQRICAGCPVQSECLEDALAWEQPSTRTGVRGGLSAAERHREYHQRTHEHHEASEGVAA